jgi:hypothetical protein
MNRFSDTGHEFIQSGEPRLEYATLKITHKK